MTGQTYTSFRRREKRERPFRIIKIGLNRPREELYARINQRVDQMMADGLLEEVKAMYPKRSLNALNTVGYKELFDYLDGRWSLEEAVELSSHYHGMDAFLQGFFGRCQQARHTGYEPVVVAKEGVAGCHILGGVFSGNGSWCPVA